MNNVFLALGSNTSSDPVGTMMRAMFDLPFTIARCSSVYKSKPMLRPDHGIEWQIPFFNLVLTGYTNNTISSSQMLSFIKQTESSLGRQLVGPIWAPRIIDIDIIFWGYDTINSTVLTIPHVGFAERDFVLLPLSELAPSFVPPLSDQTIQSYVQKMKATALIKLSGCYKQNHLW